MNKCLYVNAVAISGNMRVGIKLRIAIAAIEYWKENERLKNIVIIPKSYKKSSIE